MDIARDILSYFPKERQLKENKGEDLSEEAFGSLQQKWPITTLKMQHSLIKCSQRGLFQHSNK